MTNAMGAIDFDPEIDLFHGDADYALHTKRDQSSVVLIEQAMGAINWEKRRTNLPMPIAEITCVQMANSGGSIFPWEASSLSNRIFCETDLEDRESAISDLEKYSKNQCNVRRSRMDAEIALREMEDSQ